MLATMHGILRSLVALLVLAVVGSGGWLAFRNFYSHEIEVNRRDKAIALQREQIDRLSTELEETTKRLHRAELAMRLLKVDHRVAQITVLDQRPSPNRDAVRTKLRFVEVGPEGEPLGPGHDLEIEGDVVYVDAWVSKFDDHFVEEGDPLRGTSVFLFRRLFGEYDTPNEGYVLDQQGHRPEIYGEAGEMSAMERDLWKNFWDYANDRSRAEAEGIRAVHGEAPSIKLAPGKLYKIMLRASGGLSIQVEKIPAALR